VVNADLGEECDNGGTCLGGSNAGTHCTAESQCTGNGVCILGANAETACDPTNPNACPGGFCEKCVPQGGHGCAANCTNETQIEFDVVPGVISGNGYQQGTSGSIVWTDTPLGALILPYQAGTKQTFAVGKPRNGIVTTATLANTVYFPEIAVGYLACACVRGVDDMTCGGYLLEATGNCSVTTSQTCVLNSDCPQQGEICFHPGATDCTPGYTPGTCSGTANPKSCTADTDCPVAHPGTAYCSTTTTRTCSKDSDCPSGETCLNALQKCVGGICSDCRLNPDCSGGGTCVVHVCDGKNPCASVNGAGNSGSGVIGCAAGMQGVNLFFSEDSASPVCAANPASCSAGSNDPDVCNPANGLVFNPPVPAYPYCGAPPVIALSGAGPAGSAVILNTTAIGQATGVCGQAGPNFCTDAAPYAVRGAPQTLPSITGIAEGIIYNANDLEGETICNCPNGETGCAPGDCVVDATHPHGGLTLVGSPIAAPVPVCNGTASLSGLGTAGAFTSLSNPSTYDEVVNYVLVAQ
jgi:hypothetical protein